MKRRAQIAAVQILAAASLAVAASPVLASASSSLNIGNVTITLTDLNLNDNITPWITPNHLFQPYLNGGVASFDPDYGNEAFATLGANANSLISASANSTWAHSNATMAGSLNLAGFNSIQASGNAQSAANGYGEYGALGANFTANGFTISPFTSVTVSFNASLNAATTIGYDPVSGMDERAGGHILLMLSGLGADGKEHISEHFIEEFATFNDDGSGNFSGDSKSWAGLMSASYSNLTDHDAVASIYAEAGVNGYSALAAVPEPETYGMLLAGLAMVGCVARRKQKTAGSALPA